jgi:N-acylneuraminate cytidylyltransferase
MIEWTIIAAQKSNLFDSILVTTEDEEIAEIAASIGAEILKRPLELAADNITLVPVVTHVLERFRGIFSSFCMLMANCPLREASDIIAAHKLLDGTGEDGVMSVVSYDWRRPRWALYESEGWLRRAALSTTPADPSSTSRLLCPSGAIRWCHIDKFLAEKSFLTSRSRGFELPWHRAIDIDEQEDFEMADCIAHSLRNGFEFKAPRRIS